MLQLIIKTNTQDTCFLDEVGVFLLPKTKLYRGKQRLEANVSELIEKRSELNAPLQENQVTKEIEIFRNVTG